MGDMFDEGVARGMDLGREEGYTVAKKGFDGIVEGLRAREAPKSSTADTSTQTDLPTTATVSASVQTNPTSLEAIMPVLQLPEHPEHRKGTKRGSTSEISSSIIGFSSSAPYVTSTSLPAPSPTSPALETHEKTAEFTPKVEKTEKPFISTQTTPRTSSLSTIEPTNEATRAYTSSETPNKDVLQSLTLSTTASSSQSIPLTTRSQKSALSRDFSQLEPPVESLASSPIIAAFETRSGSANFTENSQKVEKSLVFNQTH
jgi:hypothetical protein